MRRKRPLTFGDPARTAPVCRGFGQSRGTPIDRLYIASFLDRHAEAIKGRCLEIGELRYFKRFAAPGAEGCVLVPERGVAKNAPGAEVIVADLQKAETLPENAFDCFICTQTLQCIYDVKAAIAGMHRVLKPGGVLIGTTTGLSQISRYDMERWGDYWRFTPLSLTKLLQERFATVEVASFGNALAAQLFIQGVAAEDLADTAILMEKDDDYPVILGFVAYKGAS